MQVHVEEIGRVGLIQFVARTLNFGSMTKRTGPNRCVCLYSENIIIYVHKELQYPIRTFSG